MYESTDCVGDGNMTSTPDFGRALALFDEKKYETISRRHTYVSDTGLRGTTNNCPDGVVCGCMRMNVRMYAREISIHKMVHVWGGGSVVRLTSELLLVTATSRGL